ncbi:MAG: hypothetical protein ACP5QK_11990 [Myxococcota bacterium]
MRFTTPLSIEVLRWINSWGRDIVSLKPSLEEIEKEIYSQT